MKGPSDGFGSGTIGCEVRETIFWGVGSVCGCLGVWASLDFLICRQSLFLFVKGLRLVFLKVGWVWESFSRRRSRGIFMTGYF